MTSEKIREAKAIAGWFTMVAWIGCVTVFVTAMVGEWYWCIAALLIAAGATGIAIRAGHEVEACKTIAKALKEHQEQKVKSLYGEKQ